MILGPITMQHALRLDQIAKLLNQPCGPAAVQTEIKQIAYDSRQVRPGCLFFAVPGQRQDGFYFIDDALKRGAAAVVGEQPLALRHVPYFRVPNVRQAMGTIACAFFGNPSSALEVFGVTGTNGKTTTAFMIRSLLAAQGRHPGLISTVRYELGERLIPANRTTPESIDLQAMLQQIDRADCDSVAMEVSSHALDQHRVEGIDFDVAVFTNLSRDHLDYHGTMESYFAAKRRLFEMLGTGRKAAIAIVNKDDAYADDLLCTVRAGQADCVTYGTHPQADVRAEKVVLSAQGSSCVVHTPWGTVPLQLPQLGRFNIANALAALAACAAKGMPVDALAAALAEAPAVPGRLERVSAPATPFNVFVDYAHTDAALANVLDVVQQITPGRIWVVFGCGGDRDREKRPLMGAAAAKHAHHTFITTDNPRSEDPAQIAADIVAGFPMPGACTQVPDREAAIRAAITAAAPGDTVLIAGKGHENYQEFAHTVIPFDDAEVARKILTGGR